MRLSSFAALSLLAVFQAANVWSSPVTLKKTPDTIQAQTRLPLGPVSPDITYVTSRINETVPAAVATPALSPSRSKAHPIEVVGRKFFDSVTKEQFFLKGIAYQPSRATNDVIAISYDGLTIIDPMADTRLCMRDLPYLSALGVNTIRVYAIDIDKSHDECFQAYADAGIYVLADLSEPDMSVNRKSPSWDTDLLQRYKAVVDALHGYENLLGFFAGNEVTNDKTNTNASPYIKSAIRDTKEYIKEQGYRTIPVGYATNDDADTRLNIANYFACGEEAADFYGINMYEWCGYSSFYTSGYKQRTEEFKNFPIPVFFSEFGCNLERPRPFTEIDALYSHLMTDVWSGGLVYMYFEEPNEYGVVMVDSEGNISPLADYHNLQKAYTRVHPLGTDYAQYKSELLSKGVTALPCPGSSSTWRASSSLPHSPDPVKCDCMESSLTCKLATSVKKTDYAQVFGYGCGEIDCSEITTDGEAGEYGAFADCTAYQKASYVINEVFKKFGSKTEGCDFDGMAQLSRSVASQNLLESKITRSGQTCALFMNYLSSPEYKKKSVASRSGTNYSNTTQQEGGSTRNSSTYRGSGGYAGVIENRASHKIFYKNIMLEVFVGFIVASVIAFVF